MVLEIKDAQKTKQSTFILNVSKCHSSHGNCLPWSIITSQPALTHTESALSRYTGMADETVLLSRLTKCKCGLGECVRGHTLNLSYKWHPHY